MIYATIVDIWFGKRSFSFQAETDGGRVVKGSGFGFINITGKRLVPFPKVGTAIKFAPSVPDSAGQVHAMAWQIV